MEIKRLLAAVALKNPKRNELKKILTIHRELFSCNDYDLGEYQYEETNGEK